MCKVVDLVGAAVCPVLMEHFHHEKRELDCFFDNFQVWI